MTRHHDSTHNRPTYRLTATWPARPAEVTFRTSDRRHVYAKARKWAEDGALVVIERAKGHQWQHARTFDGPALLAEREAAARRAAIEAELAARTAQFVDNLLTEHNQAEHNRHTRLMQAPPVPRRASGRLAAAHVVVGRGIR